MIIIRGREGGWDRVNKTQSMNQKCWTKNTVVHLYLSYTTKVCNVGTARFGVSEVPKILDVILYVASDDTTPGGANIGYVKTQISSRIVTTFVYE